MKLFPTLTFCAALFGLLLGPLAVAWASPDELPFPREIEDPTITGINKLPPHATMMPYGSLSQALKADRTNSPYCRMLDGQWQFHWVSSPEMRPIGFEQPGYDASKWKSIAVPSNWQMKGYGTPNYLCSGFVFKTDPPHVMGTPDKNWTTYTERNPVGSYRRWFDLPANWKSRRTLISFDGVDSNLFLWVNGQYVGYSTDSRTVAEFDITPFLKPGKNLLAAQVYRFSAGSYLEDQDMWFLSGIFRSVRLWSTPKQHIQDFFVNGDLDSDYKNGILNVQLEVNNTSSEPTPSRELMVELYDAAGKPTGVQRTVIIPALTVNSTCHYDVTMLVKAPTKWNAEHPYLYTTVLTLKGDAETKQIVSCRTGFRKVEVKGRLFCINGVPVKLKGSNRHENWPDTGHVETDAQRIRDLKLLKQANCNHVRTSHYSNDPRWYELCDQYGIYLVAEANVECHGDYAQGISKSPEWRAQYEARITNSVMRDRNHPSVVIWSLGNESYSGSNLDTELARLKLLDDSRPSHYQGYPYGKNNPTDIDSQMYSSPAECASVAKGDFTKPFYLCEYAHAMNNSMGALGEYNDIIDENPALMGGAIWEWQDQVLWNRRDPSKPFLAMGGGFGDEPNHGAFIIKGVVFSDRTPTPKYYEVKRVYQWIKMAAADLSKPSIRVTNRYAFTNTDQFEMVWRVKQQGVLLREGTLPSLSLEPGASRDMQIPIGSMTALPGTEYLLELGFRLKNATLWAPKGYELASGQWVLPIKQTAMAAPVVTNAITLKQSAAQLEFSTKELQASIDRQTGMLTKLAYHGRPLLDPKGGFGLWTYRAPHVNDDFWAASDWKAMGLNDLKAKASRVSVEPISPSSIRVDAEIDWLGDGVPVFHQTVCYLIQADGSIAVDISVIPLTPRGVIARMGMRMLLNPALNQLSYYGRGPQENYPDRMRGADLGLYRSSVAQQLTQYVASMECGNHMDTRWTALTDRTGQGVMVQSSGSPFAFSALPYIDEQLGSVNYRHLLPTSQLTALCVSAGTMGVGSAACGPGPLPQYTLYNDPATFSFIIKPLSGGQKQAQTLSQQSAPERVKPVAMWQDGAGLIQLINPDSSAKVSYSVDGQPELAYTQPIKLVGKEPLTVNVSKHSLPVLIQSVPRIYLVDRSGWRVLGCDSDQGGPESVNNILDGRQGSYWHTRWGAQIDMLPHWVAVDMGQMRSIKGLLLTSRVDMVNGRIADYEVYISKDGLGWGSCIAKGRLANTAIPQQVLFNGAVEARYIKLVALSEQAGQQFSGLAEFSIIE